MQFQNHKLGAWQLAHAGKTEEYRYFLPKKLPQTYTSSDTSMMTALEAATHRLGELNAYTKFSADVNFFIQMHVLAESTASNKIEGTKTSLEDAIKSEKDISPEDRDDWKEVQNYVIAMDTAMEQMKSLPLTMRVLNDAHKTLLSGVRGKHKSPGVIRTSQNWIGGDSITDASYIPPQPHEVAYLLSDLEKFLNTKNDIPLLVKTAWAHYQFETIHPYLDGNGRTGRLLIILYLKSVDLLSEPVLYISQFFEEHRTEYYSKLNEVRETGKIDPWIKFFLKAVEETSFQSAKKLNAIANMRQQHYSIASKIGPKAQELLDRLYAKPITTINEVANNLSCSYVVASRLVKKMEEEKLLHEITKSNRNRLYVYRDYLTVFQKTS